MIRRLDGLTADPANPETLNQGLTCGKQGPQGSLAVTINHPNPGRDRAWSSLSQEPCTLIKAA